MWRENSESVRTKYEKRASTKAVPKWRIRLEGKTDNKASFMVCGKWQNITDKKEELEVLGRVKNAKLSATIQASFF